MAGDGEKWKRKWGQGGACVLREVRSENDYNNRKKKRNLFYEGFKENSNFAPHYLLFFT